MNPKPDRDLNGRVRPYEMRDRPAVRKICADTGFLGNPVDPLFEDRELFADFLTAPYTDAEPECCFVWESKDGRILGSIIGSRDSKKHFRFKALKLYGWARRALQGYLFTYSRPSKDYLRWIILRGKRETPPVATHVAHLHINLLPEVRGIRIGRLLLLAFLRAMAKQGTRFVNGQIITQGDRRTERTFNSYGFVITHRVEITKFKKIQQNPIFLCSGINDLHKSPELYGPVTTRRDRNRLLLSFHDFHAGSRKLIEEQMRFCLERLPGHASVLVVPEYHHHGSIEDSAESLATLTQWNLEGHDLAIHGYYHDRSGLPKDSWWWTQFYTNQEAEYFRLSPPIAIKRLDHALQIWNRQKWHARGFVAPGWLYDLELEDAMKARGLHYTSRLRQVRNLRNGRVDRIWAGAFSVRASWRRGLSRAWHPLWKQFWGRGEVIRLSLHPRDLTYPSVRKQVGLFLDELAQQGYRSVSYAEHVQL